MIWFIESYNTIHYFILTYLGIDITFFSDFQKLVVIIGVNIMVWLIIFIIIYILKHIIYKYLSII